MASLLDSAFDHPLILKMQDYWSGKPTVNLQGEPRSPKWPGVRRQFLLMAGNGFCAVCGYTQFLNVHHIKPFHLFPTLELNLTNLITLGEKCPLGNHHLFFGHLGNWASWNEAVVEDAVTWLQKIKSRPQVKQVGDTYVVEKRSVA
jgi:5-methylcytosine-specific restriction enzyme A